jgi:beta-galactosidase
MVQRDRNHPSVFMWSIENQGRENSDSIGIALAYEISGLVRSLDPSRPVTANIIVPQQKRNAPLQLWSNCDPYFAALDICGYSYQSANYESDHQRLPDRIMFSSEIDPRNSFENWMKVEDLEYVLGNFEWTAMDFMGEVSLGWWGFNKDRPDVLFPWQSTYSGDFDLCGFKRPRSYYRNVLFKQGSKLSAFVYAPVSSFEGTGDSRWGWDDVKPSWTWPGYEGKSFKIETYSACDSVQILLNKKSLGFKSTVRKTEFKASWQVPYERGTLTAIGYKNNKEQARWQLITAGKPVKIQLTADRTLITADGQDLSYITVEITDKYGILNPQFNDRINFNIEGEGTIAAVGNSNPKSVESFQQPFRKAYEGRCLVIIRSNKKAGQIILHASCKGLTSHSIIIKTNNKEK